MHIHTHSVWRSTTVVRKDGRVEPAGLTARAIYHALRKRAKQAGVRSFSPHDLRRTFVGDLLDAGADVATVQKLVGQRSGEDHRPATTVGRNA